MPIDRTLSVRCIFVGQQTGPHDFGGTMYYVQTGSNPPMPNLIDITGNINMALAGPFDHSRYTQNIDITFSLAGYCPDGATLLPVTWATVINNDVNASAMIVRNKNGVDPIAEITARWVDPSTKAQILIDDDNNDTNDYYYRPAVVIPARNNYYISCDPQITNKGTNN